MSNLDPVVQIGDWYYQVIYGQLWPADVPFDPAQVTRLEPRLHSLLNFFLLHPNTLLAKDTLIEKVWPADEGTDAAVMRAVGALRKVLGDDVRAPSYIATVSKKGYCWLAPISNVPPMDRQFKIELNDADESDVALAETPLISRWPWRFVAATAAAVLLGCASLAFILATLTAEPLVKLPDTISPISALSGQEYWPVLNAAQSKVVYQHLAPDSQTLNWSVQDLTDLKIEHLPQQYQQLSQAVWLGEDEIVFRGQTLEQHCYFYRQKLQPEAGQPVGLWPCQQVMPQGLVQWRGKWLWLDANTNHGTQLWTGVPGSAARLLRALPHSWYKLEQILLTGDTLYLLADETQNNSILLKLELPDGKPELVNRFPYVVGHFSQWAESQLLLAPLHLELQILDLPALTSQRLGPLTRELTQALRYPGQVLATQFLDYTTDIFKVQTPATKAESMSLLPWHVSNRSERLLAIDGKQAAFVSERAGHSQIWLEQGRDSAQLTRLSEQQQVQQLLWHQQDLLILINSQLYRLDMTSQALVQQPIAVAQPGRFASCDNALYWTELTDTGWKLYTVKNEQKQLLHNGVVDVRCAPNHALLLQFAADHHLVLRTTDGTLNRLPVQIDWHTLNAEQWFSDGSGIYWLAPQGAQLQIYQWASAVLSTMDLPIEQRPVAIYSNGNGLGYVVRPRPHDTDIVWLQNRR
jgi:DNA-binding winged helix-turn-helix (wHTH) protein